MLDIFAAWWHKSIPVVQSDSSIIWNELIVNYPIRIPPDTQRITWHSKCSLLVTGFRRWCLLKHCLCTSGLRKNIHFSSHIIILLIKCGSCRFSSSFCKHPPVSVLEQGSFNKTQFGNSRCFFQSYDNELAWYTLNDSHQICFYGLLHKLGSHILQILRNFWLTRVYNIIKWCERNLRMILIVEK